MSGRLIDKGLLTAWATGAKEQYPDGPWDAGFNRALESVINEASSGRLDTQPAEVNAPVNDGLPKITFENHLLLKRKLEKFLLTSELIPVELHRAELKQASARPTSQWIPDWRPIETVPKTGEPVLVLLEEEMLNSRVHAATYHPNIVTIGCQFEFDAPKAIAWMPQPPTPPPTRPGEEV